MGKILVKSLDNHFEIVELKAKLSLKTAREQKLESTVHILEQKINALTEHLKLDYKVVPAKPMKVIPEVVEKLKVIKKK